MNFKHDNGMDDGTLWQNVCFLSAPHFVSLYALSLLISDTTSFLPHYVSWCFIFECSGKSTFLINDYQNLAYIVDYHLDSAMIKLIKTVKHSKPYWEPLTPM